MLSVQKKDSTLQATTNDMERIVAKLSEKELSAMQLSTDLTEAHKQIKELQNSLKDRDGKLKAAVENPALSTLCHPYLCLCFYLLLAALNTVFVFVRVRVSSQKVGSAERSGQNLDRSAGHSAIQI